jgi:RNA polymerase sigma-70 factor (ECF subfamily)
VTPQRAFDEYHQPVFRFAYRLTRRQDVAEDLTQECFLALIRAPQRFDEARGNLKTYLFSITRNLALKFYRDEASEGTLEAAGEPSGDPMPSIDVSSAVAQAIAALPPLQHEAVILFEYEGFSLQEIADVVGADVGTVKSRLHRARERLRRALAPYRTQAKEDKCGTA